MPYLVTQADFLDAALNAVIKLEITPEEKVFAARYVNALIPRMHPYLARDETDLFVYASKTVLTFTPKYKSGHPCSIVSRMSLRFGRSTICLKIHSRQNSRLGFTTSYYFVWNCSDKTIEDSICNLVGAS